MLGSLLGTRRARSVAAAIGLLAFWTVTTSFAEEQEAQPQPDPAQAAVWKAAEAAMKRGPQRIELRDQGQLDLPAGYSFIPAKEGAAVMDMLGNSTDARFIGLIFPASDANWFVTVDYEASGYIKDDDAKDWNADELLSNLKEGTEASNEHRRQIGVPEIAVTRWVERPGYDAQTHRLVWSAEARDKSGADKDPTINYNTYVLGREGYISLNLITTAATVEADKPAAHQLLGAVNFNDGKRYGDFNSSTDKVAAYGLAALIGGIAAKKLGLLAAAGVFLVKFAKLILVGLAAVGGAIAKWFKGRNADQASS